MQPEVMQPAVEPSGENCAEYEAGYQANTSEEHSLQQKQQGG